MNYLTLLPDGTVHVLSPQEAEVTLGVAIGYREHVDEADQPAIDRFIDDLRRTMALESQFDVDLYTPPWYVPGWTTEGSR